VWCHILRICRN